MKTRFSSKYRKSYKKYKKNSNIADIIKTYLDLIRLDHIYDFPHDHKLRGEYGGFNSFAPLGKHHDLRIAYKIVGDVFVFIDIGSHKELYG